MLFCLLGALENRGRQGGRSPNVGRGTGPPPSGQLDPSPYQMAAELTQQKVTDPNEKSVLKAMYDWTSIAPDLAMLGATLFGAGKGIVGRVRSATRLEGGSALENVKNGGIIEEGGNGTVNGKANFPTNESQLKHIFRDADGHLPDTLTNRNLIEGVANNPKNYIGTDTNGTKWFAQIQPDGSQVWVRTYNGSITNAGLNTTPKDFDPQTGLNYNPFK